MVANVDGHQNFPGVLLVERSLMTNDNDNSFSAIVQRAGGYKPTLEQLIPMLRSSDWIASTRRLSLEDWGWHVNKSRKAKYSYHEVEADPSLSWNDGSSEDVLSLG